MIRQRQPINAAWTEPSMGMAILWWTPQLILLFLSRLTSALQLHKPFFFCTMLEWTILSHTHRHSPRSRSADTHQSYECRLASVHWNSWGTNQAREAAGECHISPCCCTSTQTHTQTQHMPPHAQKQTDYSSLSLTHVHTMTHSQLSSHWSHTQTHAQLSTCLYRLNRCRSLREVG